MWFYRDISIHAPREGGDAMEMVKAMVASISIHAPREGGDVQIPQSSFQCVEISIHAPREGGDGGQIKSAVGGELFQSTPPARGGDSKDAQFYLRIFDK